MLEQSVAAVAAERLTETEVALVSQSVSILCFSTVGSMKRKSEREKETHSQRH